VRNKLPELFQQQLSNLGLNEVSTPFKIEQDWLIIRVIAEREVDTHIDLTVVVETTQGVCFFLAK
jgi:parvulin-like peptidyl-prolyl isomerase